MTEKYSRPILDLGDDNTFKGVKDRLVQGEDPTAIDERLGLLNNARNAGVPVDGYTLEFVTRNGDQVKFAPHPGVRYTGLFAVAEVVVVAQLPINEDDLTPAQLNEHIGDE